MVMYIYLLVQYIFYVRCFCKLTICTFVPCRDLSGMKKQNEPAIVETTKRAKKVCFHYQLKAMCLMYDDSNVPSLQGTKNLKLLSFGEEEEEALTDTKRMKIHSSHDSVLKPTDSRLSSEVLVCAWAEARYLHMFDTLSCCG